MNGPSELEPIAIFGDLHGHLLLMYALIRDWEMRNGRRIGAYLQVGDLGCYPPPFRLDEATRRFADKDPEELGFARFHQGTGEAADLLDPGTESRWKPSGDLFFIHGNHEDFQFLADVVGSADQPVAVDFFRRIYYLPDGIHTIQTAGGHMLQVGAIGGISHRHAADGPQHSIGPYIRSRSCRSFAELDVLLTHEPPADLWDHPGGASMLSGPVSEGRKALHVSGHWHQSAGPALGDNLPQHGSWVLNEVHTQGRGRQVKEGCMLVVWLSEHGIVAVDEVAPPSWPAEVFLRVLQAPSL